MSDSPQHTRLKQSPLLFWPRFGSRGSLRSLQLGRVLAKSSLKCSASVGGFLWLWAALNPGKFLSILQIILTLPPSWHTSKETCQGSLAEQASTARTQKKLQESPVPFPILLSSLHFFLRFDFLPCFPGFSLVMLFGFKTFWNCNHSTFLPWRQLKTKIC